MKSEQFELSYKYSEIQSGLFPSWVPDRSLPIHMSMYDASRNRDTSANAGQNIVTISTSKYRHDLFAVQE